MKNGVPFLFQNSKQGKYDNFISMIESCIEENKYRKRQIRRCIEKNSNT